MNKKFFTKKISPSCSYCVHGTKASSFVLCEKYGAVDADHFCKKFEYDPLSRVPLPSLFKETFSSEDFEI